MTGTPDPPRDASLRALFDRAAEQPAHARDAWLAAHVPDPARRAELQRLLRADASGGYLDTSAEQHAHRLGSVQEEARPEGLVGQRIGAFRLVRLIGQGGMAAVFLGEREGADFAQRCAVKLLRRGLYSEVEQRLFQRERRVLASLDHPNIARLVDGGVTEAGIPYLVMEYVDGVPVTAYAAAQRLDLRARLRLVLTAAEAVDAAHRALVVHRDIKPSNLLVTADGTLKLLDFGIAKLLQDDSDDGTRTYGMFTPGYAAPEQRDGGTVTTATDVYALGVVLHELLLGRRPADDAAPRRPSTLAARRDDLPPGVSARALRGDLDTILLKALAAEPARRYPSAGALAADLQRHLQGLPVAAHPPSRGYLLGKFVQRHRLAVLAGGALALSTFAGLGIALWQAREAREQARLAQIEAQRANQVRDFLIGIFESAGSSQPLGQRPDIDDLMSAAVKRIRTEPMPDRTRARMLTVMARSATAIAEDDLAASLAAEALAILRRQKVPDPEALLEAQLEQINVTRYTRPAQALAQLQPLLPRLQRADDPTTVRGALLAANVLFLNGRYDAAVDMVQRGAAGAARVHGADSRRALEAALVPGVALARVKRFDAARAALEPAIARWQAAKLPAQIELIDARNALASVYAAQGEPQRAEAELREVIALVRSVEGKPKSREAVLWSQVSGALLDQRRLAEAWTALDRAFAILDSLRDALPTDRAQLHSQRAALRSAQREFARAQDDLQRTTALLEAGQRTASDFYGRILLRLALARIELGALDQAREANQRSLAVQTSLFGPGHAATAPNLTVEAMLLLAEGRAADALPRIDAALASLAREPDTNYVDLQRAREQRVRILRAVSREKDALTEANALVDARRRRPHDTVALATALALRADTLQALGRANEARRDARDALALRIDPALLAPATTQALQAGTRATR